MYGVKGEESSSAICRGCLSPGRRLAPLSNYDLYFTLLDNKQTQEDFKFLNILLCWECSARLRSIETFRKRLQDAQLILASFAHVQKPTLTLSTLKFDHKQGFDHIIEEFIETKPEIDKLIDKCTDIDVKEEINCQFDDRNDDSFNNDNFSENDIKDSTIELKVKKEKKAKKSKTKFEISPGERKRMSKISNGFDLNNLDLYFTEVCLSETEVQESFEKERDDGDSISRPHKCNVCGIRFATKTELQYHKRDNHKKRFFAVKCPLCPSRHETRPDFQLHWRRSHPVYRCGYCGLIVDRDKDRYLHLYQHKYKYLCTMCDFEFKDRLLFSHHVKELHSKYVCDHCGKTFVTKKSLESHVMYNHLPNKCETCGAAFNCRNTLRRHWRTHTDVAPAYCVECDMTFPSRDKYVRHLSQTQRHRPRAKVSAPSKCPDCGKNYARRKTMMRHYKLVHLKKTNYYCALCDKYYLNSGRLRIHQMYFHEKLPKPKNKQCEHCEKKFSTNFLLANHVRTHTGERPFVCSHCSAAFTQKQALAGHVKRAHKYVPCPVCNKVFSRRQYMKNHVKLVHSNNSKHHCAICDKYFISGFSLRTHKKFVHEKVSMPKTKICYVCGRGFGTNRILENHIRTHTGERPFACARCSASFAQRVALRAHLAAIHKEK